MLPLSIGSKQFVTISFSYQGVGGGSKSDSNNFWKSQLRILRRQTSSKYRQKRKELLIVTDYYKEPSGTLTTKWEQVSAPRPSLLGSRGVSVCWLPIGLAESWPAQSRPRTSVPQPKGKEDQTDDRLRATVGGRRAARRQVVTPQIGPGAACAQCAHDRWGVGPHCSSSCST